LARGYSGIARLMGTGGPRSRWMLYGLSALAAIAVVGIATTVRDRSNPVRSITVGGRTFSIPVQYVRDEPPLWLRMLPGLDDGSREFPILISAEELAGKIPAYIVRDGDRLHDLLARVVILTDVEQSRYLNPEQFSDIWNGTGAYQDRVIERDDWGLVRVYRRSDPGSWAVFSVDPGEASIPRDVYSFWLGQCLQINCPICETGMHTSCRRTSSTIDLRSTSMWMGRTFTSYRTFALTSALF
jgi:hypothetical protein